MKAIKLILLSIIVASISFSCTKDSTETNVDGLNPTEYYQELDISYGPSNHQKFDLYLPRNRSNTTKVIVLVHGGGWSGGDKVDMNAFKDIMRLDLPDIAIVNINYRLADANHNPYPMQIEDLTSVIDHLKEKQDY